MAQNTRTNDPNLKLLDNEEQTNNSSIQQGSSSRKQAMKAVRIGLSLVLCALCVAEIVMIALNIKFNGHIQDSCPLRQNYSYFMLSKVACTILLIGWISMDHTERRWLSLLCAILFIIGFTVLLIWSFMLLLVNGLVDNAETTCHTLVNFVVFEMVSIYIGLLVVLIIGFCGLCIRFRAIYCHNYNMY